MFVAAWCSEFESNVFTDTFYPTTSCLFDLLLRYILTVFLFDKMYLNIYRLLENTYFCFLFPHLFEVIPLVLLLTITQNPIIAQLLFEPWGFPTVFVPVSNRMSSSCLSPINIRLICWISDCPCGEYISCLISWIFHYCNWFSLVALAACDCDQFSVWSRSTSCWEISEVTRQTNCFLSQYAGHLKRMEITWNMQ